MDYLQYWKPKTAAFHVERQGTVLDHSAGNQLWKVEPGDRLWIVTAVRGELRLLGRMDVARRVGPREARRIAGPNLWKAKHHLLAGEDSESLRRNAEPMRQVPIARWAADLRFQDTPRDRLEIRDGRVNAQQLQTLRRITPSSASLLQRLWDGWLSPESVSTEHLGVASAAHSGGGYGEAERNRVVETAAVEAVRAWYDGRGWSVESVEADRIGFDLRCRKSPEEHHVEVKGTAGTVQAFLITEGEVARARTDRSFVLAVVTEADSDRRAVHRYSGEEFLQRFERKVTQYRATLLG